MNSLNIYSKFLHLRTSQVKLKGLMGKTTRSLSTSSSEIYELRTYNIHPNKLKDYVSLTLKDFGPRIEKSKPLGFWIVELGGLNQALHIWPYALYEIHFHHMIKNNWSDSLEGFLNSDFSNQQNGDSTLVGAFQTVCGQLDTVTLLWQHKNLDGVTSLRKTLDDLHEYKTLRHYTDRINTKVMSPFITSHWK